jgi:hypothetical protein
MFPPEHQSGAGVAFLNKRFVWNSGGGGMPQTNRFAFMRDTARSHPFLVASWAAMGGILIGGVVTLKMLQPESRADKVGPSQAVAQANPVAKPAPKPVAETTGAAPSGENATADCDHQTWPYLSRTCMDAMQAKNRAPRVVSTDKLAKPTVNALEAAPPSTTPVPSSPVAAPPTPVTAETAAAPASPPPAAVLSTTAAGSATASVPVKAQAEAKPAQAEEKPAQTADLKEAKPDKSQHVAKRAKRKPKAEARHEPKAVPEDDADDNDHIANADSDDRAADDDQRSDDRVVARGRIERRHAVERRPNREYNVPADDGSGDRRFVVIRRSGGGLFGNLFGGFGD